MRPNQSQLGFWTCTKTWLRLIWSQTGPGKVADQSPISRRLVADRPPTTFVRIGAWLSLKLVGDWSAIGRRLIGDLPATSLQLVGDLFDQKGTTGQGQMARLTSESVWWSQSDNDAASGFTKPGFVASALRVYWCNWLRYGSGIGAGIRRRYASDNVPE